MNDESDFRSRFEALRKEEAARIPGFEQVLRRARQRRGIGPRAVAASACLGVIAVAAIWLPISHHRTPVLGAVSLAQWRAPTDFLLYTPGRELLHSVPRIGEPALDQLPSFPSLDQTDPPRPGQEPHS